MRTKYLSVSLILGLGLVLTLLWLLGEWPVPASAAPAAEIQVCTEGPPTCDYASVQDAVDAASDGDVVKVAAGTYTGVSVRSGITQVVYINKAITIQGGYTLTNWTTPDPDANPTILDAQGKGRGLYLTDVSTATVAGLHVTGGQSADDGGGIYVKDSEAIIRDSRVFSNTASGVFNGCGGVLLNNSDTQLLENTIYSNTANIRGGGVCVLWGTAILSGNHVVDNSAPESGGGIILHETVASLEGNQIISNTASVGSGVSVRASDAVLNNNTIRGNASGGVWVSLSDAVTLSANTIVSNTADAGAGALLEFSNVTLYSNTIRHNAGQVGGGIAMRVSVATLKNNDISFNQTSEWGGGLFLEEGSHATLIENTIASNTSWPEGGGIFVREGCSAVLTGNVIISNTTTQPWEGGGGMSSRGHVVLTNNVFSLNHAAGSGGGFKVLDTATLEGNTFISNTSVGGGGGLCLSSSVITLTGNTFASNTAGQFGGGIYGGGSVTIRGNTIVSNTAERGGGLYFSGNAITLTENSFVGNKADSWGGGAQLGGESLLIANTFTANRADELGGGLNLRGGSATLVNNLLVENRSDLEGAAIHVCIGSAHLLHTTVASNTGSSAIYVSEQGSAWLTNTILVSHTTGISVTSYSAAALEATLWENLKDWDGLGTIVTGTINLWGSPAFANPHSGDYHITANSLAMDAGVDAGATADIDGQPRPAGLGYDIGADEYYYPALAVSKKGTPNPVQAGATLTYTIYITNTGNVDLHATVTDTLPTDVTPSGILTWTPVITFPGGVWVQTVTRTVAWSYAGPLTNVVQVATDEGATGAYTETTTAQVTPALTVTKVAEPDPVQAGALVAFTIRITNTGNADLHAIVTDTLPAHVTPGDPLTWTPTITAPSGTWTQVVTRTVAWGYAGPLTNVVQVTTDEGATGTSTATTSAQVTPGLIVSTEAHSNTVQAGAQLTYTIRITNTGNVTLTAIVTDVLPSHVTPTGVLTWTPTIAVPGGVWTQVVVVTVDDDYTGPLSNTVWVATDEGATGTNSVTVTVIRKFYLPLVLRNY